MGFLLSLCVGLKVFDECITEFACSFVIQLVS